MTKTFQQVTDEVAKYLADKIKDDLSATTMAEMFVFNAEPRNGEISFEVPSRYTLSGNPLPCTFDAPGINITGLAEDALNAACLCIQTKLGVDDGGFASLFFTGENHDTLIATLEEYIHGELAQQSEGER